MKNLLPLLIATVLFSCKTKEKAPDENQSTEQVEKKATTNTVKEEPKPTNCNNEKIAYDFLSGYIALINNKKSGEEIKNWLEKEVGVTSEFMKEYKTVFDNNEYVEADPILHSQDFPDSFIVKESNDEYVSLTGVGWKDYEWIVRVKECKVIGSGIINIPLSIYSRGIDNLSLEQQIQEIRDVYAKVNKNLSTYKVTEVANEGSTEGGTDKVYIHNNGIVKITQEYLGEMGKRNIEYYFTEKGDLRFVFDRTTHYNSPMYITEAGEGMEAFDLKKSKFEENRYYFYNNKMIRWLLPTGEIADYDANVLKEKEQELLKESQKYQ